MTMFIQKLYKNKIFIIVIVLVGIAFSSYSTMNSREIEKETGLSLGITSVPNLRDLGGYTTADGYTIKKGLVYRSNQLFNISRHDMLLIGKLNLKSDFDLRTSVERNDKPDELPEGVNNVWLDVMADIPSSGPANLNALLSDARKANIDLGGGKVEELFKTAYRHCISLPSAKKAYRELFLALGDKNKLPALFHCATGKDRTGWAAAALLTLLGVPMETVKLDYLRSNDYILPMYESTIKQFIADGGSPNIPIAVLGVKEEYLNAAFEEMKSKYGNIENYFAEALGINAIQQNEIKKIYLRKQ